MTKVCDILCPDKKPVFANVSLSRNTAADWVSKIASDLKTQWIGDDLAAYSLAVNENTQLTLHSWPYSFMDWTPVCVTEDILYIKSIHRTTKGTDFFENACKSVSDMKLPRDKLIGSDGAPAICGDKSRLVGRMWLKICSLKLSLHFYCQH